MAYRDLTKRYTQLRKAFRPLAIPIGPDLGSTQDHLLSPSPQTLDARRARRSREEEEGGEEEDTGTYRKSLPPLWADTLDSIDHDINKIENQIKLLQSYHRRRLRISFDDTLTQDRQIQETTRAVTTVSFTYYCTIVYFC